MNTVIRIIGTVIVCLGLAYLIKPGIIRALISFFSKGFRLFFAALVRFALAIVFLMGAKECKIPPVIVTFGLIFLLSGLLIFFLGLDRARGILKWYLEQPNFILRILAIVVLAVGLIIVYAA